MRLRNSTFVRATFGSVTPTLTGNGHGGRSTTVFEQQRNVGGDGVGTQDPSAVRASRMSLSGGSKTALLFGSRSFVVS